MEPKTESLYDKNGKQNGMYPLKAESKKITCSIPEKMLFDVMKETVVGDLKERIKELERCDEDLTVSDPAAEEIIRDKLNNWKKKNVKEIDAIDIYSMTRLPIEQIGRILMKLEKDGVVKEDDGN